jgi:hypothetical protein
VNTQLLYLTYVTLLTAVIWIPYILNEIIVGAQERTRTSTNCSTGT